MTMNVGQSELHHGDPELMLEMNTTPLIDVMLVLLVMLIITIPLQMHAVNVEMPQGNTPPPLIKVEPVTVEIRAGNQIMWNGKVVTDTADLDAKLQAIANQPEANQAELHIKPTSNAKYETVATVMASAQRHGLKKMGLANIDTFAAAK